MLSRLARRVRGWFLRDSPSTKLSVFFTGFSPECLPAGGRASRVDVGRELLHAFEPHELSGVRRLALEGRNGALFRLGLYEANMGLADGHRYIAAAGHAVAQLHDVGLSLARAAVPGGCARHSMAAFRRLRLSR